MPKDSKGNHHPNFQLAHAADRGASRKESSKPPEEPKMAAEEPMGEEKPSADSTTLQDHGDGTFHTEGQDGMREEHQHIGHALMSMAAKHGQGADHMHVHHEGGKITTHHVGADGGVQGPHDHANTEALKAHMDQFLGEEQNEGSEYGGDPAMHQPQGAGY